MAPNLQGDHQAAEAAQEQNEIRSTEEHPCRRNQGDGVRVVSRRTSWRKQEIQEWFPRLCKQYKQRYQEGAGVWGAGESWGTLRKGLAHRSHSVDFLKRKVRIERKEGERSGLRASLRGRSPTPISPVARSCRGPQRHSCLLTNAKLRLENRRVAKPYPLASSRLISTRFLAEPAATPEPWWRGRAGDVCHSGVTPPLPPTWQLSETVRPLSAAKAAGRPSQPEPWPPIASGEAHLGRGWRGPSPWMDSRKPEPLLTAP